jgi:hypothetical protein
MKKILFLFALLPVLAYGQKTVNLNKDYIDSTWVMVTLGRINADYAANTAAVDGTRYWDFLTTGTVDPASLAEVNSGYFAYDKTAGSNGVYTINALEGVARSSYADEAGTFRGVYGRIYIAAGTTATMRTGVGGEFSARAGYSGGTNCVAENGTAFVGARIWMAPYFTSGSLTNITNFHGLWIFNEHTSNKVTDGIFINDAGGTGGWTYGISMNGATIGTADLRLHNGALLNNIRAANLMVTEDTVEVAGVLLATGTLSGAISVTLDTDPAIVLTVAMCKNRVRINNDADAIDYSLPTASAGLIVLFYDVAGGVITVDAASGDAILLNGVSVGTADAIDSPGAIGNFICLMAIDDTRWVSLGQSGTWIDGGAD